MVPELATILLGVVVGAVAVLYAASKGYLGRTKKAAATTTPSNPAVDTPVAETEHAPEIPTADVPAAAEPAPSPVESAPAPEAAISPLPALYENVQPAPAPATFAPSSASSFAAPTLTPKPVRTYRRRTAPVRGAPGSRKTPPKPKKR